MGRRGRIWLDERIRGERRKRMKVLVAFTYREWYNGSVGNGLPGKALVERFPLIQIF